MEIKKKYLKRTGWLRIEESRFSFCEFDVHGFSGVCSLFEMVKVKEPLIAEFRGETLKIADDGYFWLQVAPKGENFWITAMYDTVGTCLQYYFDMTDRNVICGEDSHFFDTFLDLVAMPDGRLIVLDRDELDAALSEGVISADQFRTANDTLEMLKAQIPHRYGALNDFCKARFDELKKML